MNIFIASVLALLLASLASAQTSSDLVNQIQALLDKLRVSVVTSNSVTVKLGESIQAALDAAPDGTTIRIQPGVYPVNLILRAGKTGIVLRSDVADPVLALPWVTPALVGGKLATLVPLDPLAPIVSAAASAHDYTLRLLEIGPNLAMPDRGLVDLGDINQPTLDVVPFNIHVDRCYIHGSDAKGGHRGIMLNTKNSKVERSYLSNFWEQGRDSQAVSGFSGPGPYVIENNYLEGSGENVMFGGSDPKIPGLIPSDIIVRGNYLYKPLAWKTKPGSVKNLFELKNAQRVLIEGNVFENVWTDGQAGNGLVVTVRNQDGGCPWCTVRDVTFQYNVVKNAQGFFLNVLGLDNNRTSVQAVNLKVLHNLGLKVGNGVLMDAGFVPSEFRHNTLTGVAGRFLSLEGPPLPTGALTFVDNVVPGGAYGITSSSVGVGLPSLTNKAPGAVFHHNVIEGNLERTLSYPPGNYLLPPNTLAGRLDGQGRYTGPEASSDGKPLGADAAEILKRIPWLTWP